MDYISIKEAAEKWVVTERMARRYCTEGKIDGAILDDKTWLIPFNAKKPKPQSRAHRSSIHNEIVLSPLSRRLRYEQGKNNHFGVYEYTQVNLAYSSNRMASNRLTREQVISLFRTNKVSVSFEPMKVDDVIETINHFECGHILIDQLTQPLTQEFIRKLHIALYYGTYADRKKEVNMGNYRKGTTRYGIHPGLVRQKMAELISWYERTEDISLETLLDFHVRFEKIHPYEDGNGRIGRLLLLKECLRFGICPFIIDDKRRGAYHKGIEKWDTDRSILIQVCLEAQDRFQRQYELCKLMQYCRSTNK